MIKAGVVGASGYAGAELVRILSGHCEVELTAITSRQYAGTAFIDRYDAVIMYPPVVRGIGLDKDEFFGPAIETHETF